MFTLTVASHKAHAVSIEIHQGLCLVILFRETRVGGCLMWLR
jgi:hypothetical protein